MPVGTLRRPRSVSAYGHRHGPGRDLGDEIDDHVDVAGVDADRRNPLEGQTQIGRGPRRLGVEVEHDLHVIAGETQRHDHNAIGLDVGRGQGFEVIVDIGFEPWHTGRAATTLVHDVVVRAFMTRRHHSVDDQPGGVCQLALVVAPRRHRQWNRVGTEEHAHHVTRRETFETGGQIVDQRIDESRMIVKEAKFRQLGCFGTDLLASPGQVLPVLTAPGITTERRGDEDGGVFNTIVRHGGDRVGLIGKNGAGKSTLLKLLTKDMPYDSGTIAMEKDVKIGFLRQDIDFELGRTVLEESYQAFEEIKALELKLDEINHQLVERTDYESDSYSQLIIDLNDVTEHYEILGGYNYQGETEKILQGLGFKREDFDKKTETFSGGWRMRIELAKLLLQSNDVLLLDEPTNHLDIESIIWLENFLTNYSGAVVIVSHDKMFLDNVTNRTIEISLGRIYDYNKPYTKYLVLRNEMKQQQLNAQKNQEKEIQQAERLIEKFRAKSTKASMAQSLIKKLDKIERIEVDEDDNSVMSVRFPISITPGKVVTEIEGLSKSYGEKHVLQNINLLIERDTKTAFVGQNGQGKSTLAKIMVGELEHEGQMKLGHNVQIGYFAQNQAEYLDGSKTVLDTMIDAANEKNRSKVRDILGSFLFRGDEVDKYVKVLSGGERNRLALAKMLLQPFNVLVMDEPTNHLDIKSKNVLKQALDNFEGTLILVSHDRDFLQGLTNKVYEFKDRRIKEYLGDIDYYLEQRKVQDFRAIEKKQEVVAKKEKTKTNASSFQDQKKLKSLKNKISTVESNISQLEKEIANIDHKLLLNYDETIAVPNFFDSYQKKKSDLEEYMKKWEKLTLDLEKM